MRMRHELIAVSSVPDLLLLLGMSVAIVVLSWVIFVQTSLLMRRCPNCCGKLSEAPAVTQTASGKDGK